MNRFFQTAFAASVALAALRIGHAQAPAAQPHVWRNVEIVGGGFVTGIVFSPKQPDLVYARTDIGGAYRWNPTTRRWIPLNDTNANADWNLYGIESIGVDPVDPNRVYVAAGTYTNDWAGNGAILRSSDQGRRWQRFDLPFKLGGNEDGRSIGERLAVDPSKNGVVYFGTRNNGLWKSVDFGATWAPVPSFPVTGRTNGIGIGFLLFDTPRKTLYAAVARPGENLYRSRDDGATWEIVPGAPTRFVPHHGVVTPDGTLYLTCANGPGPNGVTDGAVWKNDVATGRWTEITPLKPTENNRFGYAGLSVDAANPKTLIVSTLDKWSTKDDAFRSTDGGKTWRSLHAKAVRDSSGAPFLDWGRGNGTAEFGHWIGDIEIDPFRPNRALYVTGATIWGTDDLTRADADQPTHWTVRAQGLEETAVLELLSPPAGPPLISGLGDIAGFRHDDLTVSPPDGLWTNPTMNTTNALAFAANRPQIVVRVGSTGALSTDGARTWTPFPSSPPGTRGGGSIALSADGTILVWSPNGAQPFVSIDRGKTWTASTGAPSGTRVVADPVNPSTFYALSRDGDTLFASVDGGLTFTARASDLPKGNGVLRAVFGRTGDLWLPSGAGLLRSTDGGARFTKIASVERADAIGFGKAAPRRPFPALFLTGIVGGISGVFRSDDIGVTWVRIDDDAHRFGTRNVITGDPRVYGRVYLGTNGRGILYADPAK